MSTFTGTENGDILPGLITGLLVGGGHDIVSGGGGNDIIAGYAGDDTLEGGAGADVIIGGVLNVALNLGSISLSGNDTATYATSDGGVTINLAGIVPSLNIDLLGIHLALNNAVIGAGGHAEGDTLVGIQNLIGSGFNDALTGDAVANALTGNAGNDVLSGGDGGDTLDGGLGADKLYGDAGGDTLLGGAGKDVLMGGEGADVLNGGADDDVAAYSMSDAAVVINLLTGLASGGHAAGDTLINIESLIGSNFDDSLTGNALRNTLTGGAGLDTLNGGAGDDNLEGGVGADHLIGGSGFDFAYYARAVTGVVASLATGGSAGEAAGDTYSGVEGITGSNFADYLEGDAGANYLRGGAGADTLVGGGGVDQLMGGAGADTFVFAPDMKQDRLLDFDGTDTLDVRAFGFASVSAVLSHAVEGTNFVRIDFGDGDRVTIENYTGGIAGLQDHILV